MGAAITAVTLGAAQASAAEVQAKPTAESVAAVQHQLESQGVTPTVRTSGGVTTKDYTGTTPSGSRVVVETTQPAPVKPGQVQPQFHVGVGNGIYIYLDRTDQNALIYGGSTALGVVICGTPGVGTLACAGVSGALAAAATYLSSNGFCSNELEIHYLGFPDPFPSVKCV
ncbi:hypothetical protein [Williamsia sterculiae]|uniref:PASTA domain-containing protein n=1 Tax=Williamsia sterculiae TaxID=1344003 RepID=A0A1N7HDX5_9NOCA|nr:hypothetical protein [Williamsia sterculiae]SIS23069.1 hypothetical protein SAMN05445060_4045 [Williamsia sterculiae]